ncbi:MAG: hypothetical protein ABIH25_01670 [Candidatus Woesearchaeota archaeon]
METKKINFGCGKDIKKGFLNVDYPEINLNKPLHYQDNEFDYGLCKSVIPYLKNLHFSLKEMKRICKKLEVAFPHFSVGTPNQISYGKVYYLGFSINNMFLLKPDEIIVKNSFFKIKLKKKNWKGKLMIYFEQYLSAIIKIREMYLIWNKKSNNSQEKTGS